MVMPTYLNATGFCMKCDTALLQASKPKEGLAHNKLFHTHLLSPPKPQEQRIKAISAVQHSEFPDDHKRRWLISVIVTSICLAGISTWCFGFSTTEANAMVPRIKTVLAAQQPHLHSIDQPFTLLLRSKKVCRTSTGEGENRLYKRLNKLYYNV